jgi:hypothetical protein
MTAECRHCANSNSTEINSSATHSYELLGERVAIVDATASILDVVDGTITTDTVCIRAVTDEPAGP